MKLTKYVHACIALEDRGQTLLIDPGTFTPEFGPLTSIAAVVVTHNHADHFSTGNLKAILAASPETLIFTTQEVAAEFDHPNVRIVKAGQEERIGPFELRFLGEQHQLIHESLPCPHNTAVMVNDQFFYPGDSFTMPDTAVKALAIPANAPWTDIARSIDYLVSIKPEICIPTHNGLLSETGHLVYNGGLTHGSKAAGTLFEYLEPGESYEF